MILSEQQAHMLLEHALEAMPQEACGLIAGRGSLAQSIVPLPNIASDPFHFYEMEQQAFVKAMFEIERQGLSLIGIYHSHPNDPPLPSPRDIRLACYPEVEYVIVSLQHAQPCVSAWHIRNPVVEPAELYVGAHSVHADVSPIVDTLGQKIAIVVSALIAFILVLVIALALLPPPPPFTG